MRWWQHLDRLKRMESPQALFLVTENEPMQRALAAWPVAAGHLPDDVAQLEVADNWPDRDLHMMLWSTRYPPAVYDVVVDEVYPVAMLVEPPLDEWARLASMSVLRSEDLLWQAIEHSLVYPDGTVHGTVLGWLTKRAMGMTR